MNKFLINIYALLLSGCTYAMDENLRFQLYAQPNYGAAQQTSKKHQIQKCQDVSLIPLQDISKNVEALPSGLQARIKQDLSQSWIFNVAMLLPEIREKIILKMADDHEKIAQYFSEGPMLHRFITYHNNWDKCLITVGGKKFSAQQVFMMSPKDKDILIKIANPSLARYMIGQFDSSTITFEEAQELGKLPQEFLGNMKLTALQPEPEVATKTRNLSFSIGCLFLAADVISGIIYGVTGSDGANTAVLILGLGGVGMFCSAGLMHCMGTSFRHEHALEVKLDELGQVVVE